jgi:hypothetical protein
MKFSQLILLLSTLAALALPAFAAGPETRFSKQLAPAELTAAGLAQLSSDQLAILDALVRRDIDKAKLTSKEPPATRFSERLTADERRNAGIDQLAATEVAALDASVQRLIVPRATGTFGLATSNGPYSIPSLKLRRDPKIETHMAAMVAVGSDGYSAFGAGIELSYDDPNNDFGISVSYSEIHEKGGHPFRYYDRYYNDRYYRRSLDPFAFNDRW